MRLLLLKVSLIVCLLATSPAYGLTVIMYHRFGDSRYPSTNTTLEQLALHIDLLANKRVVPLDEAVVRLQNGEDTRNMAAITVDDAFLSFYHNGFPAFAAAELPVTLFVSTGLVGGGDYMDKEMLKEVAADGLVVLGNHGVSHRSFTAMSDAEITAELAKSQKYFTEELELEAPTLFSYPYGEAGSREMQILEASNFVAAFGQHSGAIGPSSRMSYLPRFALNERYGSKERVAIALAAEPLGLELVSPLAPAEPFKTVVLRVLKSEDGEGLSCFGGKGERLAPERRAETIAITAERPFGPGRSRINCTKKKGEGWGWFGWQFFVPPQ